MNTFLSLPRRLLLLLSPCLFVSSRVWRREEKEKKIRGIEGDQLDPLADPTVRFGSGLPTTGVAYRK